jgi:sigma-B regulation protein RsbQ
VENPILARHNVRVAGNTGSSRPTMMFAHGYGCDQNMWRHVTPAFEAAHRIVLFDYPGHGGSPAPQDNPSRYDSLDGYASDVLAICEALDLRHAIFVGHSVSSMIGALASIREPDRFDQLIMIGPSPRYINDQEYVGGFGHSDITELLESLDANHLGWSSAMAPVIMGRPDRPELGLELTNSFCRTDPAVARQFARATFFADNRDDLSRITARTLILQCAEDVIAPAAVGQYLHRQVPGSELVMMSATGHCPNLSAPEETISAIRAFLARG